MLQQPLHCFPNPVSWDGVSFLIVDLTKVDRDIKTGLVRGGGGVARTTWLSSPRAPQWPSWAVACQELSPLTSLITFPAHPCCVIERVSPCKGTGMIQKGKSCQEQATQRRQSLRLLEGTPLWFDLTYKSLLYKSVAGTWVAQASCWSKKMLTLQSL